MILKKIFLISSVCLPLFSAVSAFAEEPITNARQSLKLEFRIVTAHLPPWSAEAPGAPPGILEKLLRELTDRAGYSTGPEITFLPWKRAQIFAAGRDNVMIFPMMRTNAREKRYGWLQQVDRLNTLFVTYSGNLVDLEKAKGLDLVTVRMGTPMQAFLEERKFSNLMIAPTLNSQLSMLKRGRVQAWYVSEPIARYTAAKEGIEDLVYGPPVTVSPVYIATSPVFPRDVAARYRRAFLSMRRDGSLDRMWTGFFGRGPQLD